MLMRSDRFNHLFKSITNSLIGSGSIAIYLFCILSILYYFLRFQFGLIRLIPLAQYSAALYAIGLMIIFFWRERPTFQKDQLVLIVLMFLIYNFIHLIGSLISYGAVEALYVIKNYFVGLILYFVVLHLFKKKQSLNLVFIIMICCSVVAGIHVMEFISRTLALSSLPDIPDFWRRFNLEYTGAFKYSVAMDQYSKALNPEGRGVNFAWVKVGQYILPRFAGVMGTLNASGFIMAIGAIISFSMIMFRHPSKAKFIIFLICIAGLIISAARTSLLSAISGMLIISVIGQKQYRMPYKTIFYLLLILLSLLIGLYLSGVINLKAFSYFYSMDGLKRTINIISEDNQIDLFILKMKSAGAIFFGYGFPPINYGLYGPSTPIVSDHLFFLQLLSQYGVVFSLFFLTGSSFALYEAYNGFKKSYDQDSSYAVFAILALFPASLVSSLHTMSVISPQINPILVLLFACYSVLIRDARHCPERINGGIATVLADSKI